MNVTLNNVMREDVRMEVGATTESVTVTAAAAILQTDRADVSTQLDKSQVTNLPIGAGRNFQQLYKIIPGAAPPAEAHSDAGNPQRALVTNFNGVSYSNNNTRLDGATVSYPWLPHIVAYVPAGGRRGDGQHRDQQLRRRAGHGGRRGGQRPDQVRHERISRHRAWFHTNSRLQSAQLFLLPARHAAEEHLQSVRRHLRRTDHQEQALLLRSTGSARCAGRTPRPSARVPTAALRAGDFSGTGALIYDPATGNANGTGRTLFPNNRIPANRIDPIAAKMIALIPAPNLTTPTPANNYFASGTYEFNRDNFDFKVNYNPTEKSTLFARYSISPSQIFDPPSLGDGRRRRARRRSAGQRPGPHPERGHRRDLHAVAARCCSTATSASRGSGWARRTSTSTRTTGWTI